MSTESRKSGSSEMSTHSVIGSRRRSRTSASKPLPSNVAPSSALMNNCAFFTSSINDSGSWSERGAGGRFGGGITSGGAWGVLDGSRGGVGGSEAGGSASGSSSSSSVSSSGMGSATLPGSGISSSSGCQGCISPKPSESATWSGGGSSDICMVAYPVLPILDDTELWDLAGLSKRRLLTGGPSETTVVPLKSPSIKRPSPAACSSKERNVLRYFAWSNHVDLSTRFRCLQYTGQSQ
ncbi:hypothetical protein C8R47DRAFT_1259930 [Mycena vitilis]|nr:hypothetical protein C8R47DRAFT_1259930 [Mycena vitilis]